MSDLNMLVFGGRATRDAETRFTPSGTAICELGVASGRKWKSSSGQEMEDTTFIDFTAFGKTAEFLGRHVRKGCRLVITGRLQLDQWDDKQTGAKRSKLKGIAESVNIYDWPDDGGDGSRNQNDRPQNAAATARSRADSAVQAPMEDDDIPF